MTEIRSYLDALVAVDDAPRQLAPGDHLFKEGDTGAEMFIVRTGTIRLRTRGRVLESVGPGGLVGELALIDSAPRSASAFAAEPSSVTAVNSLRFQELVRRVPGLALEVMRIMARRLRQANRAGGVGQVGASPKRRRASAAGRPATLKPRSQKRRARGRKTR